MWFLAFQSVTKIGNLVLSNCFWLWYHFDIISVRYGKNGLLFVLYVMKTVGVHSQRLSILGAEFLVALFAGGSRAMQLETSVFNLFV